MDNQPPQQGSAPPTNNSEPVSGPQSIVSPNGGMRVIQPTDPNLKADNISTPPAQPITSPQQERAASSSNVQTPDTVKQPPQSIPNPSSIYPEPQTAFIGSSPVSRSSLEEETSKRKKHKHIILTLVCIALVLLAGVGGFLYWYIPQDHSIYAKLTSENYTQNGVNISFLYPSILKPDASQLAKLQNQYKNNPSAAEYLIYDYQQNTPQRIGLNVTSLKVASLLGDLNLTPAQLLDQIKSGSGSFVDAINKANPATFSTLFNGCNNFITNTSNQRLVTCYTSTDGFSLVQLVGVDSNYQYNLFLFMPNAVWSSHPKVWQKVEKSFVY